MMKPPAPPPKKTPPAITRPGMYQVPQRFNMLAVLVMTTALAVVCGVLRSQDARTEFYVYIALLTTLACAAQLYFPRAPRLASTIAGWALSVAILFAVFNPFRRYTSEGVITLIFVSLLGAFFGYAAGTIAAGVFMVTDWMTKRRGS